MLKEFYYTQPKIVFILIALTICVFIFILVLYFLMMREDKKHIYRLAYYDELTGMKNLHWFEENSPKIIRNNKEKNYVVLSFNLNRFDIIRSCYGEEAADEILKYSASVFYQETISKNGYPARANSDYFLSLIPYENPELLDKALRMICKRYEDYSIKGDMLKLKMVFGVCLLPKDGSMNIKKAINAATVAMREADSNFSPIVFFNEQMLAQINFHESIRNHQEQALRDKEFEVYYQPKFNMKNHTLVGAEALVRWNSKENGFLSPVQFIQFFEKNGFIVKLDFFVLETVLSFLQSRIDSGKQTVPISVNQSRIHLNEETYLQKLKDVLSKFDLPKGMLELELTETAFSDIKKATTVMQEIRNLGFLTSIDDFGSGYSSLTMLNAVPIDVLKLDRFFLSESYSSERTKEILIHIISMADALNIRVIAEGVETEDQADFLMSVGCNYAQGYLYGRPMPQKAFEALLDKSVREIFDEPKYG
ncbi:MAG: putative bifunctional diguanylate cyclase/phosphodiesterase [Flexilinea sp.]